MKSQRYNHRYHLICSVLPLLIMALLASSVLSGHAARNPNPGIAPINSSPYGLSYGEWGGAWWQWAVSIPKAENPVMDTTGEFAAVGQSGPLWFLAGSFGGSVVRNITVPSGKGLFYPIVNSFWLTPEDIPFTQELALEMGLDPSLMTDEELMRLAAVWQIDLVDVDSMTCTIDGVPVQNLESYRATSPAFSAEFSDIFEDFGYPAGPRETCVTDGYLIILSPPSRGFHTIHSMAAIPAFGFELDITYNITVE